MKAITLELPFKPYAHQRLAHQMRMAFRFLVLVWHRRGGKTLFAVLELLLAALAATRAESRFAYVAPQLKQAKAVAWDYLKGLARLIPGAVIREGDLQVDLPNSARIRLWGADNPDGMRGLYFDGVVMDEIAQMKAQVWGEIVRPALADRQGWALFIGTPKGINLFSELYYRALKEEGWKADLRRAADTGVIPAEELEKAKREMTAAQYAQEMDCDFAAAVDDALLRLDDVLAAQERTIAEAAYVQAPKILGVDVARYGSDRTAFVIRQGQVAFRPRIIRGNDTMTTAGQVAQLIDSAQPAATFVDAGGIGAGVIDRLGQLGYPIIPVDFGSKALSPRFENKRVEMWWLMADWVRAGACLPDSQELVQDLTAPRYTYANARGRLQLESKDDMRDRGLPSPDVGDALACTFAAPVAAPGLRHSGRTRFAVCDYDPHKEG